MAYYRTGGGNGELFWSNAPDVTGSYTLAASATKDITVTQKPKYIMMYTTSTASSSVNGVAMVYDVDRDSARRVGNTSQGFKTDTNSENVTAVTDSKVTIKNLSSTIQWRFDVAIWY